MQVIRLEHPPTGLGPYTNCHNRALHDQELRDRVPCMNIGSGRMPLIDTDHPDYYKFGFANVEQAERWWDKTAQKSAGDTGFMLSVYEVPDDAVIEGNSQVAFDPRVAVLVKHINPHRWLTGDLNMLLAAEQENDPHK